MAAAVLVCCNGVDNSCEVKIMKGADKTEESEGQK